MRNDYLQRRVEDKEKFTMVFEKVNVHQDQMVFERR